MKASARAAPESPPTRAEPQPGTERGWIPSAAAIVGVAAAIVAFFLAIYLAQRLTVPLGWDTSSYLWRTALVKARGLGALHESLPPPVRTFPDRPGFPLVAGALSALGGVSPVRLAAVIPALSCAAIGLAAGALVSHVLRRPPWECAVVAGAVATSAAVVRLAAPEAYQDNLFGAAILLAAAVPLAMAARGDPRGVLPGAVLLGAAGAVHWATFLLFAAAVLVVAVATVPRSLALRRSGVPTIRTPAALLAAALAAGAVLAAFVVYVLLGTRPQGPSLSPSEFSKKLRQDLPRYRLWATLPLAALGAVALWSSIRRRSPQDGERDGSRFLLWLLVAWSAVVLAGIAAYALGKPVPAHRFLAFALAVPILGAIGVLWAARRSARAVRRGPRARALAAGAVIVVGLVPLTVLSQRDWLRQPDYARMDHAKVLEAATALAYAERLDRPEDAAIVFVIDDRGPNPGATASLIGHMLRVAQTPDQFDDVYLYVGTPENFLAGRPTTSDTAPTYDAVSRQYLRALRPRLAERPLAFVTKSSNQHDYFAWEIAHPESRVAEGIALVQGGPPPAQDAEAPNLPLAVYPPLYLTLLAGGAFAVLFLAGLGWILALSGGRLRRHEALALSPAAGIAALVVGGLIADRLGVRLTGVGGASVPVAIAALGWAALWLRHRRKAT
ncbi:MAG TPA: hypothetical protein VEO00_01660 [Actinomycetota bacterium]|nr:hypothetical protein [Actinomycetota bacterium]